MAIDGFLAMALQSVLGYSSPQYRYDKSGSTVEFTPTQLKAVVWELNDNRKYATRRLAEINKKIKESPESGDYDTEIADLNETLEELNTALETIRKAVMESPNIAQASSKADKIVKHCGKFESLALSQLKAVSKR